MERTAKAPRPRRKWITVALSLLLLAWLFLGHVQVWKSGVEFDWDAKAGFRTIEACPRASGLVRVVTAPYCLLFEAQAKFFIAREFRKAGWEQAKGNVVTKGIPFLPVVLGLNHLVDWRIVDPKVTPLMEAAEKGDVVHVNQLLAGGADVNAHDQRGYTALMHACMGRHDSADVVRSILSAGADVNAKDRAGQSSLVWATRNGIKFEILRELASAGADVNVRDGTGTPILLQVIWSGKDEIAAREAVKTLIAVGVDVDATDSQGDTGLTVAMRMHRFQIAEILKKAGAKQEHSKHE